jgi:hypothetical protein
MKSARELAVANRAAGACVERRKLCLKLPTLSGEQSINLAAQFEQRGHVHCFELLASHIVSP